MGEAIRKLEDVFTEKDILQVLKQATGEECQLIAYSSRPASEGLTGFLGDHFRVTLHAKVGECQRKVELFVKTMPLANEEKAKFIDESNFYRREMLMYKLFEEMGGDEEPHPWRVRALLCSPTLLVMPDAAVAGFAPLGPGATLDLPHALAAVAALARFHAAFANHATGRPPDAFLHDHAPLLRDPTFCDSPWLRTAADLSADLLRAFSDKYGGLPRLRERLAALYVEACAGLTPRDDTLNVALHRDLWVNNILFRREGGAVRDALLLDFQCVRYGPPAFDLTVLLYLCTTRELRAAHEQRVLQHYYAEFIARVDAPCARRLRRLRYDCGALQRWTERARTFGMLMALAIFPYVLMAPAAARRAFDDPRTYAAALTDRRAPVLRHCRENVPYKRRQVELTEEFVQRYLLKEND